MQKAFAKDLFNVYRSAYHHARTAAQAYLVHCIENDLLDELAENISSHDFTLILSWDTPANLLEDIGGYFDLKRRKIAAEKWPTIQDDVFRRSVEHHERQMQELRTKYAKATNTAHC